MLERLFIKRQMSDMDIIYKNSICFKESFIVNNLMSIC